MTKIAHTADEMISQMTPVLQDETYVFVTSASIPEIEDLKAEAIGSFNEAEGLSLLVNRADAARAGAPVDMPMRCITLNVYSSLEGVGLTAAVATVLAEAGIACNMVAAYHHDHAFVPANLADRAMAILTTLQDARS